MFSKGRSRRWNFFPWDKGQCPQGALFHAVPGCCNCFQQCRVAPKCPSYPTLLEALATPWDSGDQCSLGTLSLVPRKKVPSSGPTLMFTFKTLHSIYEHSQQKKNLMKFIKNINNIFKMSRQCPISLNAYRGFPNDSKKRKLSTAQLCNNGAVHLRNKYV